MSYPSSLRVFLISYLLSVIAFLFCKP